MGEVGSAYPHRRGKGPGLGVQDGTHQPPRWRLHGAGVPAPEQRRSGSLSTVVTRHLRQPGAGQGDVYLLDESFDGLGRVDAEAFAFPQLV